MIPMSTQTDLIPAFPPEIQLKSPDGASAKISPYGAHVLSWVPAGGEECLFLSPKAEYRAGAAIRGGVPVIFPRFAESKFEGMGTLPKHGFARTRQWDVASINAESAVFWLSENDQTRTLWPHRFLCEYIVRIGGNRLEMKLSVTNIDIKLFTFTAALHTYLNVNDVLKAGVVGLKGLVYEDSANGGKRVREESERVTFPGEVDRIYLGVPSTLQLVDEKRTLFISSEGFPDAVVWNPGPEKCAKLADMEPDGYLRFVCVEAAAVGSPIKLEPGEIWSGIQTLSV
jgi:glucose-6-phosphate 1-epimerase